VANQTSATFLRVVGSELIQKYLGDGPKLVRELFRVAEEHAPSIVFIDEIDAIGTKRYRTPAPLRVLPGAMGGLLETLLLQPWWYSVSLLCYHFRDTLFDGSIFNK